MVEEAAANTKIVLGLRKPAAVAGFDLSRGVFRVKAQHQRVREPGTQLFHGLRRPRGVCEGDLAIRSLSPGMLLRLQKLSELPDADMYRAVYRRIGKCEAPIIIKYGLVGR